MWECVIPVLTFNTFTSLIVFFFSFFYFDYFLNHHFQAPNMRVALFCVVNGMASPLALFSHERGQIISHWLSSVLGPARRAVIGGSVDHVSKSSQSKESTQGNAVAGLS